MAVNIPAILKSFGRRKSFLCGKDLIRINLNLTTLIVTSLKSLLKKMENTFFEPWIGSSYSKGYLGVKILVLGHNHHCGECPRGQCGNVAERGDCCNFTNKVIRKYLDFRNGIGIKEPWCQTYLNFEKAMIGHEGSFNESEVLWNSIAFYNYVQFAMEHTNDKPTYEEYTKSIPAFEEVINTIKPDYIIAWGNFYDSTPPLCGKELSNINIRGIVIPRYEYTYANGGKGIMFKIHHPSMGFSWGIWHEVIKCNLELE